ncbi:MAG: isoleucine--tRNA ligase [Eubacteriales bacterium]|nr:isoleucine--tRNA ligase [Eubacteriales bacterium]
MYKPVDPALNFVPREEEILKFWRENEIFKKSQEHRCGCERFCFYDGPPTANGRPHIGHVITRVVKDLIPRYRSMKGYNVLRKAGWDTHGLPVELEVEKALGINGKEQIEAYGVAEFIKQCKESVWKYQSEWEEMSERVGYWVDMEHPYVTYHNDYIESVWWALKEIWDRDLIYHGYGVVPFCPRCGTTLSSHEVGQGYKDVKETSVYVAMPVCGEKDTYFSVWTTTPWTLPSNVGLCVHADLTYQLIELTEGEHKVRYYVAKDRAKAVFGEDFELISECKGSELVGKRYEALFDYAKESLAKSKGESYVVLADSYVSADDGTGIVHLAPAFGEDDARIGNREGLAFVQLVNEDGTMPAEVTVAAGDFCKDADPKLIAELKRNKRLIKREEITHNYPHCWRCDTPLIYYARHSWFIRMTQFKKELLARNAEINWIPESIGTGRFGNFLENVVDWALSRERYWGTPLPIWQCHDCGHDCMIGSIEELKAKAPDCPEEIELHRPMVDEVHVTCEKCGKPMQRVPEVIDCWFDSASMPFAQWHYPFENQEKFKENFPADFISEAVDQTRGWFYTMTALGVLLFNERVFKNCIVLGHILDGDGIKMSKHKGNVVDTWSVLNSEGADAVRWYFVTNSQPWLPSRFSAENVNELKRKFMGTVWNTYAFFVLYANIDGFNSRDYKVKAEELSLLDRWIISRLNSLIKSVDTKLENYDITGAGRDLDRFSDDLSNWYLRRSRERFWGPEMDSDKKAAFNTLYTVLLTLAKLAAPITPFMSEMIYQNLCRTDDSSAPESVHLSDFPLADESLIDRELEAQMDLVLDIVVLGRAARNEAQIKTRQPLSRIILASERELDEAYYPLILEELNVHRVEITDSASGLLDYSFKPQLRILGPRFGKNLAEVRKVLAELDGQKAYAELKSKGEIELEIAGKKEKLSTEEVLIDIIQAEGYASANQQGLTVALDTELSPELIKEGQVRELISKIQAARKEAEFEVSDRISLRYQTSPELAEIIAEYAELLKAEVLALELTPAQDLNDETVVDINGTELKLELRRVENAK